MIFYQQTIDNITQKHLIDALFHNDTDIQIQTLCFKGYPHIKTLTDALQIIEDKRNILTNPDQHNFLCIEIKCYNPKDADTEISLANRIADAINAYFGYDLYILSLLYQDKLQVPHSIVIISDIEKSLEHTSSFFLSADTLHEIIADSLPDYHLEELYYNALYLFNGTNNELSYDGVIHVFCPLTLKI